MGRSSPAELEKEFLLNAIDVASNPPGPLRPDCYFDLDLGEGPTQVRTDVPERHKFAFQSKAIYDGEWMRGDRHGVGRQRWPDGTEFIGQWFHGKAGGNGWIRHKDGDTYAGQWVDGRAHGFGVYRFHGGQAVYEGEFELDFRNGLGVELWADGSRYAGEFQKGVKHGVGEHTWPDQTQYTGSWNGNELSGPGRFVIRDGSTYRGEWNMSVIHGIGIYRWADGQEYAGRYEHDKKHGFGVLSTGGNGGDGKHAGYWEAGKLVASKPKLR